MKKTTTHHLASYALLFLLLIVTSGTSLNAQSCNLLSGNFNLGRSTHDPGFQSNDEVNTTATLSNGNFVVAWETRDGVDGDGNGAYFQVFNENGGMISGVTMPYADINAAGTGDQGTFGPKVIALTTGFVIGWESKNGPGDTGPVGETQQDVFFRVYNNMGSPVTGSTRVSLAAQEDKLESMLPLNSGGFVIMTSRDEDVIGANSDDHYFQAFNAMGVSTSGGLVNISGGAHDAAFQSVDQSQAMADLGSGTAEQFVDLQNAPVAICPGITGTITASNNCASLAFSLTVTGLQNMAMSANNEQNYGIRFVAFANATSNPYSGGTLLGTVPFANLGGGGTIAHLSNAVVNTVDPDLFIYAILDATPGDAACMPFAQTVIAMNALPVVSISAPDPIYVTNGMPPLNVPGGGLPVGGEYFDSGFNVIMDDGNGLTFSFLPNPPVGSEFIIIYSYVDGNGCGNTAFQAVTLQNAPVAICPGLGTATVSASGACVDNPFNITVTGLQNMAMSANNEQNYGVKFVAFADATSNPYSGGTVLGTVAFANLTAGGTTASLTDVTINTADPDLFIYAILDATPGDATCVPAAQTVIAINALPDVSISLPDTIFVSNGMPPLNVAGGGLPVGGVYTDEFNEAMDDGNGLTFSFLPNFFIGDVNEITYTYTDANGCVNSASQVIFVANGPASICPAIDSAIVFASAVCVGDSFDLLVAGLQNMAMSANNDQNYGVKLVAFANATSNPFSGGTVLGTVAFANLTDGGTSALLTGVTVNAADPDLFIYAILDATPGDATCVPAAQTVIAINALPEVSISLPDTIFASNGMPPLNVAGGGLPVGGVYTDEFDEAMDDGNGLTFSFLPNLLIDNFNQITYTYTDGNGCSNAASKIIFVANGPVGVDDPETLQVKIFPNPTTGIIHVQGVNADRIEVLDIHGRILSGKNHPDPVLDISHLPSGVYFIRIMVEGQMIVERMVKD